MSELNHDRPEWDRLRQRALWTGVIALALCALGGVVGHLLPAPSDPEERTFLNWMFDRGQFFRSYLLAYLFVLGIGLGSLVVLMVHHLTGGYWGWAVRSTVETATRTLPLLALLFLPLLLGLYDLYPWVRWDPHEIEHNDFMRQKHLYLNVPFFLARAVIYFGTWLIFAHLLIRWSVEQPPPGQEEPRRLRALSGPGLAAYGLTITFASIDWVMSLEPSWYSTIFGALFAVGQVLAALAFSIAAMILLARRDELTSIITRKHLRDLGSLMLSFVMLWAYMAFSQYLLIWSANLSEETVYYVRRLGGGWQIIAVSLILLHFVLPFMLLLSRDVKHNARTLAVVAGIILFMRLVDLFWITAPAFFPFHGFRLHWMDPLAVIGLGGIWLAAFLHYLRRRPLLPGPEHVPPEVHHG